MTAGATVNTLRISPGMELPADAITQTFGVLAKRGVGKTYTAKVLAEEMIGAGGQVVVLDPLDAWWGLRSSSDGGTKAHGKAVGGLQVYVFGGEHADLPLEGASGKLVADIVVEQGISCVLSLRHLSKRSQRTFVADFAERLYHRKGEGKYRTPLHVFIDEADAFAPQRVMGETARMLGAIDDLVRRGRSSGLGVTLITQRSASLNKDVLTQIEVLIAMRTISPQDRKALDEWIAAHDSEGHRAEFMASLASLEIGEAWVWSPGWLDVFKRVKIRRAKTYDSSSTPKAGAVAVEPSRLAPVDLGAIREKMAAVVEEAEANDPKKLRARIRELEGKLVSQSASQPVSGPCGHEGEIAELQIAVEAHSQSSDYWMGEFERLLEFRGTIADALQASDGLGMSAPKPAAAARVVKPAEQTQRPAQTQRTTQAQPARQVQKTPHDGLSGPQQRILDVLAELEAIGVGRPERTIVAALVGYHARTKAFINGLGSLRTAGYVDYGGGSVFLTDAGRPLADPVSRPRTLSELHERVKRQLSGPQARILDELIGAWPEAMGRDQLAAAVEYHARTKAFINGLGKMRTMGVIDYPSSGFVTATELLFPEGLR